MYQFYKRVSSNNYVIVKNTGELQYITEVFKYWMIFLKPPAQSLLPHKMWPVFEPSRMVSIVGPLVFANLTFSISQFRQEKNNSVDLRIRFSAPFPSVYKTIWQFFRPYFYLYFIFRILSLLQSYVNTSVRMLEILVSLLDYGYIIC